MTNAYVKKLIEIISYIKMKNECMLKNECTITFNAIIKIKCDR